MQDHLDLRIHNHMEEVVWPELYPYTLGLQGVVFAQVCIRLGEEGESNCYIRFVPRQEDDQV